MRVRDTVYTHKIATFGILTAGFIAASILGAAMFYVLLMAVAR